VSAATTLGEIGPEAKAAVPALSPLLEASDLEARVAAAAALARISADTPGIAEPLAACIRDRRPGFTGARLWFVQQALRELGARSVPALVKVADDQSPIVRRLAVETLGGIGEPASAGTDFRRSGASPNPLLDGFEYQVACVAAAHWGQPVTRAVGQLDGDQHRLECRDD